jgi:hypothetical protein
MAGRIIMCTTATLAVIAICADAGARLYHAAREHMTHRHY